MIFEALWDASKRGELLLVEGGFCHWHLRRDGQLTIREIISTSPGAGSRILGILGGVAGATSLLAKCPEDLEANKWWKKKGFALQKVERTKNGRGINVWQKPISGSG